MLGGLQAVFEADLHLLLRDMVHGEHRVRARSWLRTERGRLLGVFAYR